MFTCNCNEKAKICKYVFSVYSTGNRQMKKCPVYLIVENNGGKDAKISDDRKYDKLILIISGK